MKSAQTRPPHIFTGLQAGMPFSAKFSFEQERARPYTGFRARDSQGREYLRQDLAPGLTIVSISDPIAEKTYFFHSQADKVSEVPYPREKQLWWPQPPDEPPEAERRKIEGIVCFRCDFGPPKESELSGASGIAWLSNRIGLVAEEYVAEDGATGRWQLFDINLNEPEPQFFVAPTDVPPL